MKDSRKKEILTFLHKGYSYNGLKVQDMDFTEGELRDLIRTDYIMCTNRKPLIYVITIKGMRWLNDTSFVV